MPNIEFDTNNSNFTKIKVIGVGGGGNNAVNRMVTYGIQGAEFIVINTDKQALFLSNAPQKVQIGEKLTRGLGSGGHPEVGKAAAEESHEDIERLISDAELVFIAAGLGGGTGTGGAPVVAEIAKKMNKLTVAVVTMPFMFEGPQRMKPAEKGYQELRDKVDSIIKIQNNKLIEIAGKNTPLSESFKLADDALRQGIQGITEIIAKPALINLDFADVRTVLLKKGSAHMGIGVGKGETKLEDAVKQAINSPLLDTNIKGAKGAVVNITVDGSTGIGEINEAFGVIRNMIDPNADIYFGADIDKNLDDECSVTIIATGFGEDGAETSEKTEDKPAESGPTIGPIDRNKKTIVEKIDRTSAESITAATFKPPIIEDYDDDEEDDISEPIFMQRKPRRIHTPRKYGDD